MENRQLSMNQVSISIGNKSEQWTMKRPYTSVCLLGINAVLNECGNEVQVSVM